MGHFGLQLWAQRFSSSRGREVTIFFGLVFLTIRSEILEKSLILMPEVLLLILPDPPHPDGDRVFVNG